MIIRNGNDKGGYTVYEELDNVKLASCEMPKYSKQLGAGTIGQIMADQYGGGYFRKTKHCGLVLLHNFKMN
jgi:hypothetical protein